MTIFVEGHYSSWGREDCCHRLRAKYCLIIIMTSTWCELDQSRRHLIDLSEDIWSINLIGSGVSLHFACTTPKPKPNQMRAKINYLWLMSTRFQFLATQLMMSGWSAIMVVILNSTAASRFYYLLHCTATDSHWLYGPLKSIFLNQISLDFGGSGGWDY